MTTFLPRLLLATMLCAFSACREETAETKTDETKTTELTVDRFGRSAEPGPIREAVTLQEVSFMVRTHEADAAVLGQVQRRGLAEPIDDKAAAALGSQGAPAPLLAQLKASPYLLTPPERQLYAQRTEKRKTTSEAARSEQDTLIAANRVELNERIRAAERQRIEALLKEDQTRVREFEKKLRAERYSRDNFSPYQGVQRDLDQARERVSARNAELGKVNTMASRTRP